MKFYNIKLSKIDFTIPDEINQQLIYNINNSKYCLDYIIELKDGSYNSVKNKLLKKQMYSCIIQILYALNLMHINNFYHLDMHYGNFCYKKTTLKTIKITTLYGDSFTIPTNGYLWSIIDYETTNSNLFEEKDKSNNMAKIHICNPFSDNIYLIIFAFINIIKNK